MARPDLQIIGQPAEALERLEQLARARLHGALCLYSTLEEIGTSDVADEEKVPRDRPHRLGSGFGVGDKKGQMLGRVPRHVQNSNRYGPHPELGPIVYQRDIRLIGKPILPLGAARIREVELRSSALSQLTGARDEVGMDVSLGYVSDSESLFCSGLEVRIEIPVGIDHQPFTAGGMADEITGLGQLGIVEAAEKHCSAGSVADSTNEFQPGPDFIYRTDLHIHQAGG